MKGKKNWGRGGARSGSGRHEKSADELRDAGASPARVQARFEKELRAGTAEARSPKLYAASLCHSNPKRLDQSVDPVAEAPQAESSPFHVVGDTFWYGSEKVRYALVDGRVWREGDPPYDSFRYEDGGITYCYRESAT